MTIEIIYMLITIACILIIISERRTIKKQDDEILYLYESVNKLLEEKLILTKKENYLLKTMNDSMNVSEPKRFMSHRMSMAPEEFATASEEDVKPDNVDM